MSIKFVVVEQINYGRSHRAIPKLSFATEQEAQDHINTKFVERFRSRYHVESRQVKDVDSSQTMHCQCCGRAIHAALGKIAHHGYQRPGHGWQTASCFGAKHLPWEVSRDRVKVLIDHLKATLLRCEYARCAVSDEIEPVTLGYYGPYDRRTGRSPWLTIEFTRDGMEAAKLETPQAFERRTATTSCSTT